MIRFAKNTSFATIEDAYAHLEDPNSNLLSLPNGFAADAGFGIEGAIIQFLAAWRRRHADATLVVSGTPTSSDVANLAAQPYGSAALYFCAFLKFHSGELLGEKDARRILLNQVQAMQNWRLRQTMGPRGVHLSCYGGAINEFVLPLYAQRNEHSLRDEGGFRNLTDKILAAFIPMFKEKFSESGVELISQILYELFTNTHEHGRVDEQDRAYCANMRGILLREVDYRASLDSRTLASDAPVHRYFARMALRQKHHTPIAEEGSQKVDTIHRGIQSHKRSVSRKPVRFLEVTIYDAGPGLARNWAWRRNRLEALNLSLAAEYEFVRECFEMHNTTKSGRGRGGGLTGTIDYLRSLSAFMVLRTGRLSLFQDFSSKTGDELCHWNSVPTALHEACGTAFTLAIPLGLDKS